MRKLRVGVVGAGRGMSLAAGVGEATGMELVAFAEARPAARDQAAAALASRGLQVAAYEDYDQLLAHELDAVILANYFHQHAPLAIKALQAGKHVMSETTACFTLAEGVALVEAVERSGRIYMLAENYPYMIFNQEMRRLFQAGRIGEFTYGEGEYLHPMAADALNRISPGINHWRNWLPATYYCTHSLAPIMYITGTWPVQVNALVIPRSDDDPVTARTARRNDAASLIALRMDNGAVTKLLQVGLRGEGIWVRIHGSRGQMENLRHGDRNLVRVRREQYHEEPSGPVEEMYLPQFPEHHELAAATGHGGGDFFVSYHFAQAIHAGQQPFLDVYRAVAMSAVGIQAYRSALADGNTMAVPDFRQAEVRRQYAQDDWSPDPAQHRPGQPWPSIRGDLPPSAQGLEYARRIWREGGHEQ